jgi:hypothetical protein
VKTDNSGELSLAVLVPHRESRAAARAISAELFAEIPGAWAFPWVIPLAVLRRPLLREELRTLAVRLREKSGADGKIRSGEAAAVPFPDLSFLRGLSVYGLEMDLPLSQTLFCQSGQMKENPVVYVFPRSILGCALIQTGEKLPVPRSHRAFQPGGISFRAAFAANMSYRPLPGELSFEWKTGKPAWLPAKKAGRERPS